MPNRYGLSDTELEIMEMIWSSKCPIYLNQILYLIFDYPHKHYTFKHFEI